MKDLESKYKQNQLTPAELEELRKELNNISISDIENSMKEEWMNNEINAHLVPSMQLEKMKREINKKITPSARPTGFVIGKVLKIAAAILLPVLILSTFYFYRESRTLSAEGMIISAGAGERATVTLPDGSVVTINAGSSLIYCPKLFSKSERRVSFMGEGYFNVMNTMSLPFIIHTTDAEVKVLGTKFNLIARENDTTIEVVLEEGHILFSSLLSKESQELFPNQKATLIKSSGKILVSDEANPQQVSAWRQGDLVFGNAPLKQVIKTLENNYGVSIELSFDKDLKDDLFTGVISASNLLDALEVICVSYNLNYTVLGNDVVFSE